MSSRALQMNAKYLHNTVPGRTFINRGHCSKRKANTGNNHNGVAGSAEGTDGGALQ
jgi:hypothetical protein